MIKVFAEQKVVTVCMLACLVLSIFLKIFLGMLYRHMIKEADNMAITSNKLLKQCKIKFSNCYELNNGIHNIPVFVDKFISRLSLGHFSFDLIYHLSGQMMLLSVVASGIGICRSIIAGHTFGEILPFYIVSFIGLYLYFSVSTLADIKGKRRMLKINLVDYLENHLSSRMNVTKRDLEMLYGETAFQGKAAGEGTDAGRGSRGKAGRKTVELMPVGGRLTAVKDSRAAGGKLEEASPETQRAAEGMAQDIVQRVTGGTTQDIVQCAAGGAEQDMAQRAAGETAQDVAQRAAGGAEQGMAQRAAGGTAQDMVQRAAGGIAQEAAVTEEELEMLLKEFLTG